jgi:hypothetical protein
VGNGPSDDEEMGRSSGQIATKQKTGTQFETVLSDFQLESLFCAQWSQR